VATNSARGIRNNNPGNIRRNETQWEGLSPVQTDDAFFTFDTPEHGIRAMARVLTTYREKYGLDTVRKIVSRWAPDIENDTEAYVKDVSAQLGVKPDASLNQAQLPGLIAAIIKHENGAQPYTTQQIARGVQMAGVEVPGFNNPERPTVVQVEGGGRPTVVPGPEYPAPVPAAPPQRPTVVQVEPPAAQGNVVGTPAPAQTTPQAMADNAVATGGGAVAAGGAARVFERSAPPDVTAPAQEGPGAVSPEPFRPATGG
jgi:hypothetical protein